MLLPCKLSDDCDCLANGQGQLTLGACVVPCFQSKCSPCAWAQVWAVLTDYDHLADFVPNLDSCERLPGGRPTRYRLRQHGCSQSLFWRLEAGAELDVQARLIGNGDCVLPLFSGCRLACALAARAAVAAKECRGLCSGSSCSYSLLPHTYYLAQGCMKAVLSGAGGVL